MIINEKTGNIFYDETLPKKGKLIDWNSSVGKCFEILYFNEMYKFKIYSTTPGKHCRVELEYNGEIKTSISASQLKRCGIGNIVGSKTSEFKIEIGTILESELGERKIKIIDKERKYTANGGTKKSYKYQCLIDGNIDWISEHRLVNEGAICNVCSSKKVSIVNCIETTHPEVMIYLKNKNDGKLNTFGSPNKIECICPNCKYERTISVAQLIKHGFSCRKCSDGISFPNKLMISILEQLELDFVREYSPKYLCGRMSDFFLNKENIIVEMDGILGHEGGRTHSRSDKTIEECVVIDKWKDSQHLLHGVKTIRINCFESDMEYIRENILKSELVNYFDFSKVDWLKADKDGQKNKLLEVCELKNKNIDLSASEISKITGFAISTTIGWLKKGTKLKLCYYNAKLEMRKSALKTSSLNRKPVEVFKDGVSLGIFESIMELQRQSKNVFGVNMENSCVCMVCNNKKTQYKGYTFKYVN